MLRKGFVREVMKSLSLIVVLLVASIYLLFAQTRDTQSCLSTCKSLASNAAIQLTPSPSPTPTATPIPFGLLTRPTETAIPSPTIIVTKAPGCPLPPDIEIAPELKPSNCDMEGPLKTLIEIINDPINLLTDLLELPADLPELNTDEGLEEMESSTE